MVAMDKEFPLLEEWLQRTTSSSSPALQHVSKFSAREIAQSWAILRDLLTSPLPQGEGIPSRIPILEDTHLLALHKLTDCRASLHVALPQARLVLSFLSSSNFIASNPNAVIRARSLAALLFTIWLRKSPSLFLNSNHALLKSAIELACTNSTQQLETPVRILLLGCLSLWAVPIVSPSSTYPCLEAVADLLHEEKEKENILMSDQGVSQALAGIGYALVSNPAPPHHFESIMRSLLSLWTVCGGSHACIPHGLMFLNLMDWVGRNLTTHDRVSSTSSHINLICIELTKIAGLGYQGLEFAAVMAAGGLLRALRRTQLPKEKRNVLLQGVESSLEKTIFGVAGGVGFNFGLLAKKDENSAELSRWTMSGIVPPSRILILQCVAVAVSFCGGVSFHESILQCMVASLLTETFPLDLLYSLKADIGKHIESVLFKEGGSIARIMCEQYRGASRGLKKLVEHLVWGFSQALYQNHRRFTYMLLELPLHIEDKNSKALEKVTEAAFFMVVLFFSIATKEVNVEEQEQEVSIVALDALSHVESFRHKQIPEYIDMIKRTVLCVSESASAIAALAHRLPSYDSLIQFPGPSNLLSSEYYWYKDQVQTARIFFYLRVLPACIEKIPGAVFGLEVAPLMFLYMRHPDKSVVKGSHSVFIAFMSAGNWDLDSSHADGADKVSLKEQLVVYYVQTALEAYPSLTPFKALSSAVGALVRYLPAGSPAILYCIHDLVQKSNNLYVSHFMSSKGKGTEAKVEPEALKDLRVLLLNLLLFVDIQVLPDLLKLLAQLISGLPEYVRNLALDDAHDLVACSDDVTRKPILVPWLQSLSYICSGFNSGRNNGKELSGMSNANRENNLQLNSDIDKSGGLSLNPTSRKHLVHYSRL